MRPRPNIYMKVGDKYFCGAKTRKGQSLCGEGKLDCFDDYCQMMNEWTFECNIGKSICHYEPKLIYEDDLPQDITEEQYDWWFDRSIVDFVRMGPPIKNKTGDKP